MKALKEKRPSLRSWLRRGIVILSLLALAFASCGDSGGDDNNGNTNGGGDNGNGTVTPPAKYALSIRIVTQPKNPSFQGMPPDIEGVELEVLFSDSPTLQRITGDLREQGFYPTPDYCDEPGDGKVDTNEEPEIGYFYMAYAGGTTTQSNRLLIPGVIPAMYMEARKTANQLVVYSDQRPDFRGKIALKAHYMWEVGTDGLPSSYDTTAPTEVTTVPGTDGVVSGWKIADAEIPVSLVYPTFDMSKARSQKKIGVGIGNLKTDNNNGSNPFANNSSAANPRVVEFGLDAYYQVLGISLDRASGDFFIFDDDTFYAAPVDKDRASGANPEIWEYGLSLAQVKALDTKYPYGPRQRLLDTSNVTFKVNYEDQTSRTITWQEFQDNVAYALRVNGVTGDSKNYIFGDVMQNASIRPDTANVYRKVAIDTYMPKYTLEPADMLAWNDEEGDPVWWFAIQYVPKEFIAHEAAYDAKTTVEVPVYTFNNDVTVRRKFGTSALNNGWVEFPNSIGSGGFSIYADLYDMIEHRWEMVAVYGRGRDTKTKTVAWRSTYFEHPGIYSGRGARNDPFTGQIKLWPNGAGELSGRVDPYNVANDPRNQWYGRGAASWTDSQRNWPLPLVYRGEYKEADDTVLVEVFYTNQKHQ